MLVERPTDALDLVAVDVIAIGHFVRVTGLQPTRICTFKETLSGDPGIRLNGLELGCIYLVHEALGG